MPIVSHLRPLALVLALIALPRAAGAQDQAPFVYYSYERVGYSEQESYALVPRTAEAPRGTAWADLQKRSFDLLQQSKAPTYGGTTIYVNPDRSVTINLDETKRPYFPIIIGETVYSLSELGATSLSFPLLGGGPYTRDTVATPAYVATVPLWRVLPPQPLPTGLVRLPDASLVPSATFQGWVNDRDPRVVQYALAFLKSEDESVVRSALACLLHLKVPKLEGQLIALLGHPSADLRLVVVGTMTNSKDPAILAALAERVEKDSDPRITAIAAQTLRDSGDPKFSTFGLFFTLQGDDVEAAVEAARKLGEMKDKRAVPELARAARSKDQRLRIAAVDAIGAIGEMSVLKDLLGFSDLEGDAKIRAAQLLAALPDPARAQNGQVYLLLNGSGDDSANAATRLGETRGGQVVPWLLQALGHAESKTRRAAAAALAALGDPRALAPLAEASGRLPEDREFLSQQVIIIMGAQSLDSTLRLADDKNVNIRRLATESVGHYVQRNPRSAGLALPILAARIADLVPEVRAAAATALGMMGGNAKALPLLLGSKSDPAPEVRTAVARGLAAYHGEEGVPELLALIDDEEDAVRLAAIDSCRQRRVEAAVVPLINYRSHRNPEIKRLVVQTLAAINPPALHNSLREVFSEAVFDQDPEVRLAAVEGLKVIKDPRVLDIMSVLLQDPEPRIRIATLRAYGETGFPQATQPLMAALQDGSEPDVKMAALDGLLTLRAKDAIPALQTLKGTEPDKKVEAKYAEIISALSALR